MPTPKPVHFEFHIFRGLHKKSWKFELDILNCSGDIIQLLTIEALDMMWYRPQNTNIDRGGRYHIISSASIVNTCFII